MTFLTKLSAFKALQTHFDTMQSLRVDEMFQTDPERFNRFSLKIDGVLFDYSKNRITSETLPLLIALAEEAGLPEKISALFSGQKINKTENRAVQHMALRNDAKSPKEVQDVINKMTLFVDNIRARKWKGATQKPITDIINIGIGGSHLGPLMALHALSDFAHKELRCHFISNVDRKAIQTLLQTLNPETCLFIISSKSFTTIETLSNAKIAIAWLKQALGDNIANHLAAVTAAPSKAHAFGIPEEQIFPIWDWVGGRYSIWSAIGLPVAILIGMENFKDFLKGGREIDEHFRETPFEKNLPVIMALLGIWYNNFFKANTQVILPYADELNLFPAYLQQLDMESNGKRVTMDGAEVTYATGPVIFGDQGCNSQHSFYQWLHQSPQFIPLDFILVGKEDDLLMGSALAQAQAFMVGKPVENETYKIIPGNRPSNIIFLDKITPFALGKLIALYEHKVFVQGVIFGINSFDQWGVELGKVLLPPILKALQEEPISNQDASTHALITHYKKLIGRSP